MREGQSVSSGSVSALDSRVLVATVSSSSATLCRTRQEKGLDSVLLPSHREPALPGSHSGASNAKPQAFFSPHVMLI